MAECVPIGAEDVDEIAAWAASNDIDLAVIGPEVPLAMGIVDKLVEAGVKGIWNFAPIKMEVPDSMHIINEDLSIGLSSLSYYITRK